MSAIAIAKPLNQVSKSLYGIFISDFTSKEVNLEYFGLPVGICRTDHNRRSITGRFGVATVGRSKQPAYIPDNCLAPTTLHVTFTSEGPLLVSNLYMADSKIPHCTTRMTINVANSNRAH
jgi:hypothetical protein